MLLDSLPSAVIGYAIGTAQVLVIDEVRSLRGHRRSLRLLRAELRRLADLNRKYNWSDETAGVMASEELPRPPKPLALFFDTVGKTDFKITDETADDNTQQALLAIVDGSETLVHYSQDFLGLIDRIRSSADAGEKGMLRQRAHGTADAYDATIAVFEFHVRDALRDLDRRIRETTLWWQLKRRFRRLPKRTNPPRLEIGGPRRNKL